MATLEELVPGKLVAGLDPAGPVTIVASLPAAEGAIELYWKTPAGNVASRLLMANAADSLSIVQQTLPWTFDGDGAKLRLVSEAWRIHYAHLFDPYLAIHTSNVEPLPHQISAVYQEMLRRLPLRYVLADDPGAGKTIMTGLLIRELIARGDLSRCLIVSPGNLSEQWQDELFQKFSLHFEIIDKNRIESSATGNIFAETPLAIARLDKLSRDETVQEKLRQTDWDLIVCDEAHKMSATIYGGEVKPTKRFQLGQLLSGICRHFLLLTATPHNGKEEEFQLFLSLVDQDRFAQVAKTGAQAINVSDVMRRLVKEELLKFDGTPLFPPREAITLSYALSPLEATLYEAVTSYVESQFNLADKLANKRKVTVGFALTVLQRRLASSPEAIYQSLKRRRERLEKRLAEEGHATDVLLDEEEIDEDDFAPAELEDMEEEVTDRATASRSRAELEKEIATLAELEKLAAELRKQGTDRKWEELSGLLQEEKRLFDEKGIREKLIIFTEHRDTLSYLKDKIACLLGDTDAVVTIHGGMRREERRAVQDAFRDDPLVRVLVATDAAGEGLNLQRSHLMVNYDLPWNPNRLEQRFGRVHRIGQTRTCHLWNLVAKDTREGAVFERLFTKLEQEKAALGGKVFDILGKVSFNNKPLRDLLKDAVRGQDENDIAQVIDAAFDRSKILELMAEHALTDDIMDAALVARLAEDMERMEARRLQPHYIEAFFREAFKSLGGKMAAREQGRHEITHVPACLRENKVLPRYERVCFDKKYGPAALICPGHPLLDALLAEIRNRHGNILKTGAILVDENDPGEECRLLFYIESVIQDGATLPNGKQREIDRRIHFVEMGPNGVVGGGGYAPYLDYRPPTPEERDILLNHVQNLTWLKADVEKAALAHAITKLVGPHLEEVSERKLALIAKTEKAVTERLTAAIQHWDRRAVELSNEERAGKRNATLNSSQAANRAERLAARLAKRMAELLAERHISPRAPQVAGGCLIAPAGLVAKLLPGRKPDTFGQDAAARKRIEDMAMATVMAIEKKLGFLPKDVSMEKCGYDIESTIPEHLREAEAPILRFIEVKGRAKGADNITVTRNEILTALNRPEQYILALVEVDETGADSEITYLKKPFENRPDRSLETSQYNIAHLLQNAGSIQHHAQKTH